MNWLHYLAEANVYIAIFYLAYCLFLGRNTHYQLSRAYLMLACVISFVLPVLQLGFLRPAPIAAAEFKQSPAAYPAPITTQFIDQTPIGNVHTAGQVKVRPVPVSPVAEHHFTVTDALWYAYLAGVAVLLVTLLIKLVVLFRLARKGEQVNVDKYKVVHLPDTDVAFSFFNYLFIGANASETRVMITHELVHIRQRHSADIIFMELLKIVNWFNPIIYLLQNSLKTVHEYIADERTVASETDIKTYASFLLSNAYGTGGPSVTHSFFNYNLLKKRILMLNQKRSGKLARLKYLVAIPICAALLCSSTLVFSKTYGWLDLAPAKVKPASRFASAKNVHPYKRKRLKVTQNGITTVTDQIAINQQNNMVVYNAGNITAADKEALLKANNVKIEVITDSTMFTTTDGKPMLPVVNSDGYHLLDHFLHHNIHYASARGEKGGLVVVNFALDKDQHIVNPHIIQSGGAKLDALALNGFNAYKGTVNDAAGKSLTLGVYFFTDDYSIFKTDSMQKAPDFAGELIITNYKYPAEVTSKGYEYEEEAGGFPGIAGYAHWKVLIYDKNGDANWYYRDKCSAADLQMLKDKYGYVFPTSEAMIIQSIKPENVKKSRLAYIYNVPSYLNGPYSNHFYKTVKKNMEYPEAFKNSPKAGVVLLNFNIDSEGLIKGVTVAKSAGADFDAAAVKAVQSYNTVVDDTKGKHSIAIVFCVAAKKYRPVVDESLKKDGYVGELGVSELKSPFLDPDDN